MRWELQTVRYLGPKGWTEIVGLSLMDGHFAVHSDPNKEAWLSITHLPTGYRIPTTDDMSLVKILSCAQELQKTLTPRVLANDDPYDCGEEIAKAWTRIVKKEAGE